MRQRIRRIKVRTGDFAKRAAVFFERLFIRMAQSKYVKCAIFIIFFIYILANCLLGIYAFALEVIRNDNLKIMLAVTILAGIVALAALKIQQLRIKSRRDKKKNDKENQ
ncbi:MAG: hypothetical protein K0Q87_1234 [Neobacillus sp.]|jgi:hypothetical protein|nr:hypothetical protein [Neobacillus sp.]